MNALRDKQFKKLNFWNITSNIAVILCAIGITCSHFFEKYFVGKSLWVIVVIEIIGVVLFLVSRVIIFIVKKKYEKR
jgi:membrane protein YdbS with pleckstrin-like domain